MTYKTIFLTRGFVTLVDEADYEWLNQWRWCYDRAGTGYARRREGKYQVRMHRIILNAPNGIGVDHINGNGLDNRRENLRLANQTQNNRNMRKTRGTSQYKGVSWYKPSSRWVAHIRVHRKLISLGYFDCEEDAANAYNKAAEKYFTDVRRLNVIHV